MGHLLLVGPHVGLELVLLMLEYLVLLAFPLTRVVGGEAVALYALDASLLLLILGLCAFAGGQAGLGLRQDLAP